jgi:predicted SAM-dependent methyltransferase
MRTAARRRLTSAAGPLRLCLGSGHAPIHGWVNVDFEPPADVLIDLRYGLPIDDGSVAAIYSEHLVEHLPLDTAMHLFRESRRVLAQDGVVRIATPDLERLITDYRGDWRGRNDWVNWPEYEHIETPVQMINVAMREWGHLYLYDYEELALRLRDAGFGDVRREALGRSEEPALRDLETRADSTLIVEARP